jgi:hypothetical protein
MVSVQPFSSDGTGEEVGVGKGESTVPARLLAHKTVATPISSKKSAAISRVKERISGKFGVPGEGYRESVIQRVFSLD